MKYVSKIGLENEGGYVRTDDKPSRLVKWVEDESVRNIRATRNGVGINFIGEAVSMPMKTVTEALEWINLFWPDRKNKSCGFHIHTSFVKPKFYWYLVNEQFYIAFYKRMVKLGKELNLSSYYFDRLAGNNHHCQRIFKGMDQIFETEKSNARYTQLNYCFQLHGTLENRLPTAIMSVKQAQKYLISYIEFLEEYLENHPKPEITEFFWQDSFMIEDECEIV